MWFCEGPENPETVFSSSQPSREKPSKTQEGPGTHQEGKELSYVYAYAY